MLECGLRHDKKWLIMQIRKLIINLFKNGDQIMIPRVSLLDLSYQSISTTIHFNVPPRKPNLNIEFTLSRSSFAYMFSLISFFASCGYLPVKQSFDLKSFEIKTARHLV